MHLYFTKKCINNFIKEILRTISYQISYKKIHITEYDIKQLTDILLLYIESNFFNAIFVELMGESCKRLNKATDTAFCTSETG